MDVVTGALTRIVAGPNALRRWAVASLVANVVIVVTGALVRLTSSGLGCPTWPRCSADSYVARPALGVHGAIEFGNRLLTFGLVAVAALTVATAWIHRPRWSRVRRLSAALVGIPAQAVIGGITVLTRLNPFAVALHLVLSMGLIAVAVWLVRLTWSIPPVPVRRAAVGLAWTTFGLIWLVVWLGTVVTGSGPHAGDAIAGRTGFDIELVAHLHALVVYATVAATLGCLVLLRNGAAVLLLGLEALQAAVGLTQYPRGLPIGLVLLHLLGAALTVAAATNLALSVRTRNRIRVAPATVQSGAVTREAFNR